jgi:hypothetical protein
MSKQNIQNYPRVKDESSKYFGMLDDNALIEHSKKIDKLLLKKIIKDAIIYANGKSSRIELGMIEELPEEIQEKLYQLKGKELFKYFIKYCGDPASSALNCLNKHYSEVAKAQFKNRILQKERMNSGWRYQFIAKGAALETGRFISISDIGTNEADFNATIGIKEGKEVLSIYISVKNRVNTMGGQDWPKAIKAIEDVAKNDKNRTDAYLCVFGIAMQKGHRIVKMDAKSKQAFSNNTEIWQSDFFWPFFTNFKYNDIIKSVLEVLIDVGEESEIDIDLPASMIESFGENCKDYGLLDNEGIFNNSFKLVDLFCGHSE